jgi:beta-alanine--pyruvate transaminase
MEGKMQEAAHALKDMPHVIDIRNTGLVAAIEFAPRPNAPVGKRAFEVFKACFDKGLLVRATGDNIAISPPLIINNAQIDQIFGTLREVMTDLA